MKEHSPLKVHFQVRIPSDIAEEIRTAANANMRSMNTQIMYYIQEGLKRESKIREVIEG